MLWAPDDKLKSLGYPTQGELTTPHRYCGPDFESEPHVQVARRRLTDSLFPRTLEVKFTKGGSGRMKSMSQQESLEGRIVGIIRRDLMLGDDLQLTPDAPLFGGGLDLDSLDALLLMQSLEAEFGFKMATEAFGPDVFKSVASLARFVEEHRRP